jgi:hypothetical protein
MKSAKNQISRRDGLKLGLAGLTVWPWGAPFFAKGICERHWPSETRLAPTALPPTCRFVPSNRQGDPHDAHLSHRFRRRTEHILS